MKLVNGLNLINKLSNKVYTRIESLTEKGDKLLLSQTRSVSLMNKIVKILQVLGIIQNYIGRLI